MFALDLFNTDHERRLAEGAVDQLEQRRIDDLAMKMDDLVARAKTATTPESKAALVKEFQKCKTERDGYYKIKDECMGYGSLGEADQVPAPAQPVRAGTDLVTPQQRVTGATPPSNTALGKAKSTFSSFVDWLAGRDDTGPTYESTVKEQTAAISPVAAAKYAYEQMRKAHDDNVDIATIRWMNSPEPITMSRNQIYHTLLKLKNMSRQTRNQFALQTLADRNNFALWLGGQKKVTTRPQLKQPADPFQPKLTGYAEPKISPVSERAQKKNSEDPNFGDAETTNAVRKIQAKHPAAPNAMAALAKDELDHQKRSDQQLAAIQGANTKQDELLKKLVSLDQEQGREIDGLDSENNSLEAQLARIQATNDRLQNTIQSMTGAKQSTRPKQAAKTTPQTITPEPTTIIAPGADPGVEKELQDLKMQINQLQQQPPSDNVKAEIAKLRTQINSLPAQAAQALNIDQDNLTTTKKQQTPRVQAPFSDLDVAPSKSKSKPKAKPAAPQIKSQTLPVPNPEDEFDLLNIDESANRLHPGDPIIVTAPNEFEGKTGEIYELSPSGTFVIVDLYNHGKHSMHLSDVEYNQYADKQEEDDWYDELDESDSLSDIDIMRQDVEHMNERQFYTAYGMSKAAFQQQYRTLLKPAPQQDTPVKEGNWGGSGAAGLRDHYAVYTKQNGQVKRIKSTNKIGKPMNTREAEAYVAAMRKKDPTKWTHDTVWVAPADIDLDEGWKSALGGAALAGAMALGGAGAAQAQSSGPSVVNPTAVIQQIQSGKIQNQNDLMSALGNASNKQAVWKILQNTAGMQGSNDVNSIIGAIGHRNAAGSQAQTINQSPTAKSVNQPQSRSVVMNPRDDFEEAANAAQQAAIAINMKKHHVKPKNESDDYDDGEWNDMPDAHIAVKAKQPARYPEAVLRAIERNPNMRADIIRDYERKQGVAETVTDVRAEMARVYRRLAPKIERHRDSFLAGQLYDELENIAELHGAENEFKRMMAGARNRAHMDYDTNPGGFQNWFWYLPFEDKVTEEFEMPGTTIPQKSVIRGYVVYYNPQTRMVSITRRGDSEEAAIEQARLGKPSIQSFETTVSKLINRLEQDLVEDENSTSSEAVEIAIIRRILVAHTDLIMEFGLDKVTQAIEEVAYNVGDVDEIGTSDVSAYVNQVQQILGVE
jgi:hypothetical protein